MKKCFFILFFWNLFLCSVEKYFKGDPFVYLKSQIPVLKSKTELDAALANSSVIVAIISYNNSFYGNDTDIFTKAARMYHEIYNLFINHKKIKFYRVNMLKGISGLLLSSNHSGVALFHEKKLIKNIGENAGKEKIIVEILDAIKGIS